jgi:hypothetical protein
MGRSSPRTTTKGRAIARRATRHAASLFRGPHAEPLFGLCPVLVKFLNKTKTKKGRKDCKRKDIILARLADIVEITDDILCEHNHAIKYTACMHVINSDS